MTDPPSSGRHATFPVAVHLFLMRGSEVLLARRFNTGYEDGNFSVVAGHIAGGETLGRAMQREALEEIGITVTPDDLHLVGVMHRQSDNERVEFFFVADSWQGEVVNNEPERCDQLLWSSVDALPPNTVSYIRRAIRRSTATPKTAGPWFEELGWQ